MPNPLQRRPGGVEYMTMESGGGWSSGELADFLAIVSKARDAASVYRAAVARAVSVRGADLATLIDDSGVLASAGTAEDRLPDLLAAARAGATELEAAGPYAVLAEPVDALGAGWLVVTRPADHSFRDDERLMLRALTRVTSLALRGVGASADERRLRREAKRSEGLLASLNERQQLLERLSRIQRSIAARAPLDDVLDLIAKGAAELLGDEVVGLRRINPDRPGWVKLVAWSGIPPELVDSLREGSVGEGAGGRAVAEDRLVVIQDYAGSSAGLSQLQSVALSSAMAAPVHENGVVVGSLAVASRRTGRRYSKAEQATLVAFADHAGLAMTDAETVRALHRALDTATHDALHDQLTGLPNRALLHDRLGQALRRSRRREGGFAMLYLDLDGFKRINDSLGHDVGDRLLVAVAERLSRCVRANDTTARLGGDEFAILLEDLSAPAEAEKAGDRILAALRRPFPLEGQEIMIDTSIGIANVEDVEGPDDLLRNADLAMYAAKASGKGQHRWFQPRMHARSLARMELETGLRRAVEERQLVVHYQPVVALGDGSVVGTEALVRWRHPERGLVPAAEFVPVAESTGLILPIDEWVLREACRQTRQWQDGNPPGRTLSVSVNVSGRRFQQPELVGQVVAVLEHTGLAPQALVLEITADVLMQDVAVTRSAVAGLREVGVRLAIDDFGTGQSSLSCLRRFPIDIIKIDQSFVNGVAAVTDESTLAHGIVNLARTLEYQTVAKGVEYAEQAAVLRAFGCDQAQGYHLGRPSPPEDLADLLSTAQPRRAAPLAS